MVTTSTPLYSGPTSITCVVSGLATAAGLLVGRASTAVDNSSALAVDAHVGGTLITTATTTANTQIQVWAFGSFDGTVYSAGASGSDAGFTPDTGAKNLMKLLTVIPNITTTAVTYVWGPFSVAQAFGGTMPIKWGIYYVQNTGTSIAAGCSTKYETVKYQSA
jgi:hypothetical protein